MKKNKYEVTEYKVPEKYEEMAKRWDEKLPELAKALRSESLHRSIAKLDNKKVPVTRRMKIFITFVLNPEKTYSCSDITKHLIKKDKLTGTVAYYLSGSVTTILAKLVKDGFLKYAKEKTSRGGHLYQFAMSGVEIKIPKGKMMAAQLDSNPMAFRNFHEPKPKIKVTYNPTTKTNHP